VNSELKCPSPLPPQGQASHFRSSDFAPATVYGHRPYSLYPIAYTLYPIPYPLYYCAFFGPPLIHRFMKRISPAALYRAEKDRVTRERTSTHARLLAEAKAAFEKLIAEGQAARKGGRPKGSITLGSPKRLQQPDPLLVIPPPVAKPVVAKKVVTKPAPQPAAKKTKPVKVKAAAVKKTKPAAAKKPARPAKKATKAPAKKKSVARNSAKKKR
jgi:hypothetical protein